MNKLIVLIVLLCTPSISSAGVFPRANGEVLKGVKSFDASLRWRHWMGMEGRDRLISHANDVFLLGLRRDGVVVESSASNYLLCNVNVANNDKAGLVTYLVEVEYFDYELEGLNTLLWKNSGMFTVGINGFSSETLANDCVDTFSNEWLKWNPR